MGSYNGKCLATAASGAAASALHSAQCLTETVLFCPYYYLVLISQKSYFPNQAPGALSFEQGTYSTKFIQN